MLLAVPTRQLQRLLAHAPLDGMTGFRCPFVPTLPVLGLVGNVLLLAQRPWQAWARFGGLIVVVSLGLVIEAIRGRSLRALELTPPATPRA